MIRAAAASDAGAICAIWNPIIRESIATFNSVEKTPADIAQLITHQPVFVTENGDQITGFATYGQFRGGVGYCHTGEHTIHLAPAAQGQGVGRALMDVICDHATSAGFHSMWAGISAENTGGIAFHAALGFRQIACPEQVGRKFGRWHDLVLMQKHL